jgi:hypothetical protein
MLARQAVRPGVGNVGYVVAGFKSPAAGYLLAMLAIKNK